MCLSSFKLMVTVALSNHGSFLFTILLKGSAHIVGKLMMHPCVPFRSGAPIPFFGHRAHWLKSTELEQQILVVQTKSVDQNNCIDEISTFLSKLKAALQEVTLLSDRIQTLESALQARENDQIRQEANDKKLNLLIHGLSESGGAWESRDETHEILSNFLKDGLKIDPQTINFIDYHRLPQRPIFNGNGKKARPIIIKAASVFDKCTFLKSAKNLKQFKFSQAGASESVCSPYTDVTSPNTFLKYCISIRRNYIQFSRKPEPKAKIPV